MTRSLSLACLILLTALVTTAPAATGPARIAFSAASQAPGGAATGEFEGASASVALPGGSVLTFFYDAPTQTTRAIRLARDGSLDPAFGTGGIAPLTAAGPGLRVGQAELLGDGRVLLAGAMRDPGTFSPLRLVLLRLLPSGAPDPSFGSGGVARTSLNAAPNGTPMAVAADGSIVVTGSMLVPGETNPLNPSTTDWVVARLTPSGAPDATFGVKRIPVGANRRAKGTAVVVTPGGSIVVLGHADQAPGSFAQSFALFGLTALGMPDPAFNAGAPLLLAKEARQLVRRANGAIDVVGSEAVARFAAAGTPDATFASNGTLAFGRFITGFVPTPDGGALLQGGAPPSAPADIDRRIGVQRVTAAGTLGETTTLFTPFGGGLARPDLRGQISVRQNAFGGSLLRRDDGSFLLIGGLAVFHPVGKADSIHAPFVAAQAFTPTLTPDGSFGGPQQPASMKIEIRRQRARTAARRGYVYLRVTAAQPGLVFLRVRDARNRVLASGTHPVYAGGSKIVAVRMYALGRRVLSRARKGSRISVRHDYRDILAAGTTGVTKGRLG